VNYKEFNKFCRSLPATTYVVQWGGSHVWKVGGKVFAIGGWQEDAPSFTFKVSGYRLRDAEGAARVAPRSVSRLARDEVDPAFREAWTVRCGVARLYPPVACDCFAGPVEEEAHRARAGPGRNESRRGVGASGRSNVLTAAE